MKWYAVFMMKDGELIACGPDTNPNDIQGLEGAAVAVWRNVATDPQDAVRKSVLELFRKAYPSSCV